METKVPLGPRQAFDLIADLRVHERWIPATRIDAPARPLRTGDEVVARSARWLVDKMVVEESTPPEGTAPGVLRLRKRGPVLLGDATITVAAAGDTPNTVAAAGDTPNTVAAAGDTPNPVAAAGDGGSRITWDAQTWLAGPLPARLTRPLAGAGYRVMLALAFRGIRRDAAALGRVVARRRG